MEITCRACARPMAKAQLGRARFWQCESCRAHAISIPSLRNVMPPEVWSEVWPSLRAAATKGARRCPACDRAMDQTPEVETVGGMRLDICDPCRFVFLDPTELERLAKRPVEEEEGLRPEVAQAFARAQVALMNAEYDLCEYALLGPLEEVGKAIFFGVLVGLSRHR